VHYTKPDLLAGIVGKLLVVDGEQAPDAVTATPKALSSQHGTDDSDARHGHHREARRRGRGCAPAAR
jgi:hypothetical protein